MKHIEVFRNLETEKLILREVTEDDVEEIFNIFCDEEVAKYDWFYPIRTKEKAMDIIKNYKEEFDAKEEMTWGIQLKGTEKIIGICCLGDFDEKARRAEIGYDLIRAYWNNGYATEAINAVVNFGINEMNLNRIEAFITPGNDASVRVLEKVNFIKEGIVRQRDYIKGKLEDGILMAILQSDLKTANSKTEEVNIKTERLLLRELKPEDYDFYLKIEKNEACLKYEDDTIPIEDDIRIKFNNNLKDRENRQRTRYRFMITDVKNKELIGRIILWRIDESINEWEIGWDVLQFNKREY